MKDINLDAVVNTYRVYAPFYDLVFGAVLEPGRQALAKRVNELKPRTLLEVGIGTGLMIDRYPIETAVVGIDVSAEMLKIARDRQHANQRRSVELMVMDAEHMAFPDNSFECVTVPYVLSVTPAPDRLISEVKRVCRKDGTILVLNHFSGSRFWWALEKLVSPLSDRIGFRSNFRYDEQVGKYNGHVISARPVNLFGLSKLVELRND
jgi:phosphatidylethanolamine/phosphatidyl-N-methylethanolamine N-methyltransferase